MVKDLLLHIIDNSQVLDAISEFCEIESEVLYSTLWNDGQPTSIRNGDYFCYIVQSVAQKLPDKMVIGSMPVRIFKPKALATCKWCNEVETFCE